MVQGLEQTPTKEPWMSVETRHSVAGQNVAVKSGTAQIASENGYLEGENDYIYSVVAMTSAENPEFIMYVTVQQPEEKNSSLYSGRKWSIRS